ncbi:MAG TPA: HmuY family protein [Chitinophagaceae bacterium]|nr:HmuY family protein [Chitinophagaceae bacterium]
MKTRNILLSLTLLSVFSSCLNKETPVPLKPKGEETTASVEMGEDYHWQMYFSLKNNAMVGKILYSSWDLGFENEASGFRIVLNGGKFGMAAYRTGKTNFASVTIKDTVGIEGKIDMPSGSLDSTAIGDWRSGNPVYVVNRGTNESAKWQGFVKIQIVSVDATKYIVHFADIDGSNEKTMDIPKDNQYNLAFLSFSDGGKTLTVEPPKAEWDIVFTKYTHYYYDLNMPYSVVGCLLNRYQTSGGLLDSTSKDFSVVDLEKAMTAKLTPFNGAIGFDWKYYDLNSGKYSVNSAKHYIILSQQGIYYKLRFIDFYQSGVKGAPKWEYQQL